MLAGKISSPDAAIRYPVSMKRSKAPRLALEARSSKQRAVRNAASFSATATLMNGFNVVPSLASTFSARSLTKPAGERRNCSSLPSVHPHCRQGLRRGQNPEVKDSARRWKILCVERRHGLSSAIDPSIQRHFVVHQNPYTAVHPNARARDIIRRARDTQMVTPWIPAGLDYLWRSSAESVRPHGCRPFTG